MSLVTSYDSGTGSSVGEQILTFLRKADPRAGTKRGVVLCHGATATESRFIDGAAPQQQRIVQAIAEKGYPCIAHRQVGDSWANDAAIAKVALAKTYLQGTLGAKSGKIFVVGGSMGGALAMAYAAANPTLVAGLILLEPVSDLQDIVTNNRSGLAASCNAAYAGGYSNATYGATHNPTSFAASLAGIPVQTFYATDDTTVIPATVTTVMTAIGGVDLHTLTGGHADAALATIASSTVTDFIDAHA